jgi:hypothetical protein
MEKDLDDFFDPVGSSSENYYQIGEKANAFQRILQKKCRSFPYNKGYFAIPAGSYQQFTGKVNHVTETLQSNHRTEMSGSCISMKI